MVRIERLSEPAQEVLRLLSAARVISHDVLADASGLGGAELRDRRARGRGVERDRRRRARPLPVPPRAAARGRPRRPAAGRARRAAPGAGARARGPGRRDAATTRSSPPASPTTTCRPAASARRSCASVRAADAAERVHAHGEAGALLERALDLWSRVPDATEQTGCDRAELVRRARPRADQRRRPPARRGAAQAGAGRGRRAARAAAGGRPARAAVARAVVARPRRGARATRSPAPSTLLPEDEAQSPERARILSRQAKIAMLQGRFSEALPTAARRSTPPRGPTPGPRADALNAMGLSLVLLGEVEEGSAAPARGDRDLRPRLRAHQRAGPTWPTRCTSSAARARRSPPREQGLADTAGPGRVSDWLTMTLGEIRWDLGDWAARAPAPARRATAATSASTFAYVELMRAEVALADGDHDAARASLDRIADLVDGLARAAVHRAGRRRCAASSSAAAATSPPRAPRSTTALDAIEFCSEDLPRIARAVGDRRRDRGRRRPARPRPRRRDAEREAISRAEGFVDARRGLRRRRAARRGGAARDGRARTWRAPAARPTRRSTPPRPRRGARSRARTRRRSRSCSGRRRSWRAATARPPPRSSPTSSPPRARSARRGCAARPRGWPPARAWRCRRRRAPPARSRPTAATRRRPVRAHAARAPGARAGRRRRDEPRDRRAALHGREDRERPRLADPRQARRAQPHRGGRGRAPPRPRRDTTR